MKETRWGPRSIDIDILYCDDLILQTETLTIPHKELYNRNFVLIPLMEIAGDLLIPS
ncbi:MAG: 2-amino-4-hydroxy-6-hydroxymethyldihydropteridine diphosphokinase [Saprospiraceae bacterium]|nr:2-amino-4-hydroxy-6-hydroxymethyldihydropteridine diphosphokinase [Saprospiraceae bacterium]